VLSVTRLVLICAFLAACQSKPKPFYCRTSNKLTPTAPRECLPTKDSCEKDENECFARDVAQCTEIDNQVGAPGRQSLCTPTPEECARWVEMTKDRHPSVCHASKPDEYSR
jgi:hypothetical protein